MPSAPLNAPPIVETKAARNKAEGTQLNGTITPRVRRAVRRCFVLIPLLLASGCNSIPTSGPQISEVMDESAAAKRYGFTLVEVGDGVIKAMDAAPHLPLPQLFPGDGPIVPKIGPGDVLSITIFETGQGELFAPPSPSLQAYGTSKVTLPDATVGRNGVIAIPFAGTVKVSGLTPLAVGELIEQRLQGEAMRPQVLVTVLSNVSNVVTVTGTIKNPGRYGLTAASETLLQLVAMAGGPTGRPVDTMLRLTRGNRQIETRLSDLEQHPEEDIHAWPQDYIDLETDPQEVLIYGGIFRSGSYPLVTSNESLARAITDAGGLFDQQADSRGVFLFRYEYPEVLRDIPGDRIVATPPAPTPVLAAQDPVIYKIDMKTASGIFYSTQLRLRSKDLIYVPTAPTVNWEKYLDLLRLAASPVTTAATYGAVFGQGR
jgi:polysaccharide biosynthesis/export protein